LIVRSSPFEDGTSRHHASFKITPKRHQQLACQRHDGDAADAERRMTTQKPALPIGSSRDDLRAFPDEVRRVMGVAINDAQNGEEHPRAKALRGFGGRSVLEVVDDED
jgi:hypothetical protein